MNKEKVSIIIPVYNGEKYIESCISSILGQTYKNIELVIINDGSTDNTKNILNKYKTDNRIKIFSNDNHGVSFSRNYGIKKSTGEYLMFVDCDDILVENAISELINIMQNNIEIDIIRFNGLEEKPNGTLKKLETCIDNEILDGKNSNYIIGKFINTKNTLRCYSCLLFIKNSNIIPFNEELKYLEDTLFYIENLCNNKKTYMINKYLYIYKYNENSVTKENKDFYNKIIMMLNSYEKIKSYSFNKLLDINIIDHWIINLVLYRIDYFSTLMDKNNFKNLCNLIRENDKINELVNKIDSSKLSIYKKAEFILFKMKEYSFIYYINKLKRIFKK